MKTGPRFGIIIPACNEAEALPEVLREWRAAVDPAEFVIGVGANGCTDDTAALARKWGAIVGVTRERGYGFGCRAAIEALTKNHPSVEAFIFVAADGASSPSELGKFIAAFEKGHRVILGQRTRLPSNRQIVGVRHVLANRLLGAWCGLLTGRFYTDLGPYRLIARDVFEQLQMQEGTYGWTIEPQILCARLGIPVLEIDAAEHRRIAGEQKVSRVSWQRTLQIGCQIFAARLEVAFSTPLPASPVMPLESSIAVPAGGFPESGLNDVAPSRRVIWRGILLLLAIWAGIYLPTLGTLELKGEEGRRILPGQTMLRNGDWIVPQVGGEPYLRKPPMINWLAAISFKLTGVENEWTARLPSVFGVLMLVLVVFLSGYRWLGISGAFAAAIFAMTNLAMMEKGRLLEIDALYSVATGIAVALWCRSWMLGRPWLNWLGIGLALAIGYLLKGPVHLLFFYAVALAVLWKAQEKRKFFLPAHVVAILLGTGLVLLWWIPYQHRTAGLGGNMVAQLTDRIDGSDFDLTGWLLNIPRGLGNLLPWVVFLPFAWFPLHPATTEKMRAIHRGLRLAVVASFLAVSLAPGALPRYTMPVTVPFALLLAVTLTHCVLPKSLWKVWRLCTGGGVGGLKILAQRSAVLMVILVAFYSLVLVPRLKKHSLWRTAASRINRALPPGDTLYAVDPGSQPIFFYLSAPYTFIDKPAHLPPAARYILARGKPLAEIRKRHPRHHELVTYQDRGEKTTALLRLDP